MPQSCGTTAMTSLLILVHDRQPPHPVGCTAPSSCCLHCCTPATTIGEAAPLMVIVLNMSISDKKNTRATTKDSKVAPGDRGQAASEHKQHAEGVRRLNRASSNATAAGMTANTSCMTAWHRQSCQLNALRRLPTILGCGLILCSKLHAAGHAASIACAGMNSMPSTSGRILLPTVPKSQ